MTVTIGRRELLAALGGAAAAWPLAARAQQPARLPRIGILWPNPATVSGHFVDAFRQGLGELGYVEGRNMTIEFRTAEGTMERLPDLAAELVRLPVEVILTATSPTIRAAQQATRTIPIVMGNSQDPVSEGFVASLNRPGGNVTGVSFLGNALGAKQVELLHELVPKATTIAVLVDINYQGSASGLTDVEAAAHSLGQQLIVLHASNERDLDTAAATLAQQRADALIVLGAAFFLSRRDQIIALAAQHGLPAIYQVPDFVAAGGLMSYGASIRDAYRLVGVYTGKILHGAKPADLPVQQSTKLELIINLKTAKALGLTVPLTLQASADEVIE
jgi:putative ABC transport system substrate-binding protein